MKPPRFLKPCHCCGAETFCNAFIRYTPLGVMKVVCAKCALFKFDWAGPQALHERETFQRSAEECDRRMGQQTPWLPVEPTEPTAHEKWLDECHKDDIASEALYRAGY